MNRLKLRVLHAYHCWMAAWQNAAAKQASKVMRSIGASSNRHEAAIIDIEIQILKSL